MNSFRLLVLATVMAACGGGGSDDVTPDAQQMFGVPCTKAAFDPCVSNDQCMSGNCHLFRQQAIQVCTVACSATNPCPNDVNGQPGECNMMGTCKPSGANHCDPQ